MLNSAGHLNDVDFQRVAAAIATNRQECRGGSTLVNEGSHGDELFVIAEVSTRMHHCIRIHQPSLAQLTFPAPSNSDDY
jgi:hypothetical protein